jgi:GntR family transcriptional regulator
MSTPKYQIIYQFLSEQIRDKKILPGDKIPNESELAAMFQVHRMTVRQAIDKLVNDHMLVRKRGKGTFLLSEKYPVLTRSLEGISTYFDDIVNAGLEPCYRTLEAKIDSFDESITSQLGLQPGDQVVYMKRLMLASNVPLVLERCYLPAELFADILEKELNTMLYKIIRDSYGMTLVHSRQELTAVLPSEEERKLLKIGSTCPCIRVEGVVHNDSGRVIEYTRSLYRGDKYRFQCSIGSYLYNPNPVTDPG